ncbi:AraC family transcriptional regulator [Paenibacillus kandeliae]|uniref:AraC family transcriptional regulator n=1 Tax=Paenibacillus kandeliae TaxID=3231269 RepID=UPI0034597F00
MFHGNWFWYEHRKTSTESFHNVFHAHSQMELTYVHEGRGQLISDKATYYIQPGTLLVFPPFQLHHVQIQVTEEQPFIRSVLAFEAAPVYKYLNDFPSLRSFFQRLVLNQIHVQPVLAMDEYDPLVALMQQFREGMEHITEMELEEHIGLFLLGLIYQLRQRPQEHSAFAKKQHQHVEDIIQWIEQHYMETFRLEHVANELHLSSYHMAHLFKEATGTTIGMYTRATRIRHACSLLRKSNLPLSEVGYRVGLPNPSYFSKLFSDMMGVTPLAYRQRLMK